jgi:replicative DNA helicase
MSNVAYLDPKGGDRDPPADFKIEQALIGTLLIDNAGYQSVARLVRPEHFADPLHGEIFKAIIARIDAGERANPPLLQRQLGHVEMPGAITMADYLGRLAGAASVDSAMLPSYGREIVAYAAQRTALKAALLIQDRIGTGQPLMEAIADAEALLTEARGTATDQRRGLRPFELAVDAALDEAHRAHTHGGVIGLSTGLTALDKIIGGMQGGDLMVLAGRPSMGKTSAAVTILINVAVALQAQEPGAVTAAFSLEMPDQQLASRVLSHRVQMAWKRFRAGETVMADMERLEVAAKPVKRLPVFVDDTAGITLGDMRAQLQRLRAMKRVALVVIDYLQLMRPDQPRRDGNRVQEVTEITAGLKKLAKDFDVPVLALSQLSRAVEQREDKRPILADLRDSGSIEQDADVVMFVYRDEYYLAKAEPKESGGQKWQDWSARRDRAKGKVEIIVEKQRNGPTGAAHLRFDAETTWIADPPKADDYGQEEML